MAGQNKWLVRLRGQLDERSPLRPRSCTYAICCTDMEGNVLRAAEQVAIAPHNAATLRAGARRRGPPPRYSKEVVLLIFSVPLVFSVGGKVVQDLTQRPQRATNGENHSELRYSVRRAATSARAKSS